MKNQTKMLKLKDFSSILNGEIVGDENIEITAVADIKQAKASDVTFLANSRYTADLKSSAAGVIVVSKETQLVAGKNYFITQNPSKDFQVLVEFFQPPMEPSGFEPAIHPSAIIHETAHIKAGVTVGPRAVIDAFATIDENVFIGANVYVGQYSQIGQGSRIYPNAVIREKIEIGKNVIIQPGAVIGSCGFGYITEKGQHQKLNQVGTVIIKDDVEIGANSTIDRARFGQTVICEGAKIDNLVQIAHGVSVGPHSIIVAQSGIAGSTRLGRNTVLAAQSGIAGHLKIDDFVMIAAKSGVSKNLKAGKYSGVPAIEISEHNKMQVYLKRFAKYFSQIKSLSQKVASLEASLGQKSTI